jgi:hypothetical protein
VQALPSRWGTQLKSDLDQHSRAVEAVICVSRKILTGLFRANQDVAIGMWPGRQRPTILSFSHPKVTPSRGPADPDGRMLL